MKKRPKVLSKFAQDRRTAREVARAIRADSARRIYVSRVVDAILRERADDAGKLRGATK